MKKGWVHRKLGDICSIERGGSPRPITDYITDSEDGINWIKIGDATEGSKYITSTKEKIKPEGMKKSRFVHKGDFILSNSMSFIHDERSAFIKDYLFYLLSSPFMASKFKQLAVGGVVNNLNSSLVKSVIVPIPEKEIQQSIALELDKINELISLKEKQLKELDNIAQGLFYELFGDPVLNEKGWPVKKLGDICSIERGGSPRPITDYITDSEDGINWIKIGDASEKDMYITSTKEKIKPEGMKKSRFVHKGDFILSNSMSFDGNGVFDKVFLYHMLSHPSMYAQFKNMAVGGVVNNLNSKMVRNVKVFVPSHNHQQSFAKKIELITAEKKVVLSMIEDLKTLLASRMQYWFE